MQHLLRDPRPQTGLGDDVRVVSEELLEIHQEPSQVEESAIVVEIDEEVDVARLDGVTAGDRPERARLRVRERSRGSRCDDFAGPPASAQQRSTILKSNSQ